MYVASQLVGKTGKVCGIDLTSEMVDLAKKGMEEAGLTNIEIVQVSSEKIPYNDNTFDTVISNGVFNLSPCKQELFKDIFRAIKKGGKLQFADVVLETELPSKLVGSAEAWSQ